MRPINFLYIFFGCMLFVLSGCTIRHGDFTVLSNRLIDTEHFSLSAKEKVRVTGEDVQHIIIVIPTSPATLEGALDDAFDKSGGDVLVDAVIKQYWFRFPYIYGRNVWKVEGTAIKTRN